MEKKMSNKHFKVPEGYFENFKDKLSERLAVDDVDKKEGFTVPDGYFEDLNKKIQTNLEDTPSKVIRLFPKRHYYMVAAAIAAIVVMVLGWQWNNSTNLSIDNLAETDIENYFEDHEFGLSSYELAEVLPIENVEVSDILDTPINENLIIDYLDNEIDNLNELNLDDDEY